MGGLSLRNKSDEILSGPKNPEFRANCSVPQINRILYESPLMQTCQDYLDTCQHGASHIIFYMITSNLI
ncbi:unnamed protein product [Blepharisma stoltei]|uniref:NADH-plastoquinone oxidoreductase subunit K n=1 Tax=Blepharisma stoltei TaxID=1481888 RepID=A0AAU9IU21_9CILI|nr:unnamed protein product [Blepharisma stoltei]